MDEVAKHDGMAAARKKVLAKFGAGQASVDNAKAKRKDVKTASARKDEYWSGRNVLCSYRATPETKARAEKLAEASGLSKAAFFEELLDAYDRGNGHAQTR